MVFSRRINAADKVMIKTLPDGTERVLANGVEMEGGSFSPDGKHLLISRRVTPGVQSVELLSLESNRLEAIDIPRGSNCVVKHPRISPDGRQLAFACTWAQGFDDLFVADFGVDLHPTTAARRLSYAKDRIDSLDWAPDSRSILIVTGPLGNGIIKRAYVGVSTEPEIVPIQAERSSTISG